MNKNIRKILLAGLVIFLGLILLKFIPEKIFGKGILFDASLHISGAIFILYILWFFIDQNKNWRIPYFIFSYLVLTIISIQRVLTNNHNDTGLLLGLGVGILGICIAERKPLKNKIKF
jgi:heme O synthase-like polyprenyltransferase